MREIKFRAWDKKWNKYWYTDQYVTIAYLCQSNIFGYGEINKDRYILEQYTGLKDKNGKEIYEGDIVKRKIERSDFYPKQYMPNTDECKEIKRWIETQINIIVMCPEIRFGCELLCDKLPIKKNSFGYDYEIIGNKYENPELLED